MSIRRKVLLALGISMLVLLALALFLGLRLHLGEILAREENAVRAEIGRVIAALHHEINHFDRETNTVSFWADAADVFALRESASPASLEARGVASVFNLHRMDILGIVNPGGDIVQIRYLNRETGLELLPPADFVRSFLAEKPAAMSLTSSEPNAWVMAVNETPHLFVSHPAVVNVVPEAAGGVLFAGRKIDEQMLRQLSRLSGLDLRILPPDQKEVPPNVRALLDGGSGQRTAVYPVSKKTIAGIIQAKDPAGRSILTMSFEKPREYYGQFRQNWKTFAGLTISLGLLLLLLGSVLVEKLAISRITKLAAFVKTVDTNAETAPLVPVEGGDEIAGLAVSINGMLDSLHSFNLERRDLIQRLESDSLEDPLTGLYNRRGFLTIGREYLNLSARNKTRMHLLFLDMDNLKQINDTFGHVCGDEALIRAAEIIKSVFRGSDIKSRLGGDEFAVFPISSSDQGLKAAVNRFHEKTAEFNRSGVCPFTLSFSLGLASYEPEKPSTIDELLDRADQRMYEEKRRKGRANTRE